MIPGDGEVRVDIDETVITITLDRPKANAIDLPTSRKLGEAFVYFRDNPDLFLPAAIMSPAICTMQPNMRHSCACWKLPGSVSRRLVSRPLLR